MEMFGFWAMSIIPAPPVFYTFSSSRSFGGPRRGEAQGD